MFKNRYWYSLNSVDLCIFKCLLSHALVCVSVYMWLYQLLVAQHKLLMESALKRPLKYLKLWILFRQKQIKPNFMIDNVIASISLTLIN